MKECVVSGGVEERVKTSQNDQGSCIGFPPPPPPPSLSLSLLFSHAAARFRSFLASS